MIRTSVPQIVLVRVRMLDCMMVIPMACEMAALKKAQTSDLNLD